MPMYSVSKSFSRRGQISEKAAAVMRMFGLTVERLVDRGISHSCTVEINTGDIVYITGPSGSGKSVLLDELEKSVPVSEKVNLSEIELPTDKTLIDCIGDSFIAGLKLLSTAGLNDVFCVLNQPANLSDGEKWRFRLAMALAAGKKFVFADEFCCELDRIMAAVIAYNIRKFAKQAGVTFILASSHEDTLLDLAPDVLVVKELSGHAQVIYKRKGCRDGKL
jgi:ABC-type ATPase with predicted acetyltransferase domain